MRHPPSSSHCAWPHAPPSPPPAVVALQQPALYCASAPRSAHLSWCSLSFGGSSCGAGVLLAEVAPSSARTCLATASTLCILRPSCSAPCKPRVLSHAWDTPPKQKSAWSKSSLRHLVPMSLMPPISQQPPSKSSWQESQRRNQMNRLGEGGQICEAVIFFKHKENGRKPFLIPPAA